MLAHAIRALLSAIEFWHQGNAIRKWPKAQTLQISDSKGFKSNPLGDALLCSSHLVYQRPLDPDFLLLFPLYIRILVPRQK
jgi:hypothetical protein